MIRALTLVALLLLAACGRPDPVTPPLVAAVPAQTAPDAPAAVQEAVVASEPLPEAVEAVAPFVQSPVNAMIEALEPVVAGVELPPATGPPGTAACQRAAAALIIRWEVTSPRYYDKRLIRPIWPQGASGITWGIGYDGGHQTSKTILEDWAAHEHRERLALTSGLKGQRAKTALPKYRDIIVPYLYASEVFETRSLIEYLRIAERTYRVDLAEVPVGVCAALVDLTYNRGGATAGDSRKEIRNIRDDELPEKDWDGVAAEIRSMKRLWKGTVNENGLSARRESEARIIETLR